MWISEFWSGRFWFFFWWRRRSNKIRAFICALLRCARLDLLIRFIFSTSRMIFLPKRLLSQWGSYSMSTCSVSSFEGGSTIWFSNTDFSFENLPSDFDSPSSVIVTSFSIVTMSSLLLLLIRPFSNCEGSAELFRFPKEGRLRRMHLPHWTLEMAWRFCFHVTKSD